MRFVKETRIAAPPAVVFAFHESPGALLRLTPPWERVELIEGGDRSDPGPGSSSRSASARSGRDGSPSIPSTIPDACSPTARWKGRSPPGITDTSSWTTNTEGRCCGTRSNTTPPWVPWDDSWPGASSRRSFGGCSTTDTRRPGPSSNRATSPGPHRRPAMPDSTPRRPLSSGRSRRMNPAGFRRLLGNFACGNRPADVTIIECRTGRGILPPRPICRSCCRSMAAIEPSDPMIYPDRESCPGPSSARAVGSS